MSDTRVLKVNDLSFSYDNKKYLFKNLNFDIKEGECVAILGPNGSGKTTLLKVLMGMLKGEGDIFLFDENINYISGRNFWQKVSFVPQQRNVESDMTVYDSIMVGRSCYIGVFDKPRKIDFDECDRIINELCIEKLKYRNCKTLSGGELQLVLIARALVSNPKILILDEPESGLDFRNQLVILDVIERLKKKNIVSIFNTHYPKHALQKADKTIMLGGSEVIYGKTEEVIVEKNIEKIFGIRAVINEIEVDGEKIKNVVPLYVVSKN